MHAADEPLPSPDDRAGARHDPRARTAPRSGEPGARLGGGLATSTVGSYARPSWLVAGLSAAERGEFGPFDLEEMLDDAVDLALRDQEDAGIDIVTDGEMRRESYSNRFATALDGCAPLEIQWCARSRSTSTIDGSTCGLYRPIVSMFRPSRGARESATTTR